MVRHSAVKPGASYSREETSFAVFAPRAETVTVNIYSDDLRREPAITKSLSADRDGFFSGGIKGDLNGRYYTYTVDGRETIDPYALSGGANSRRGMIFDPADTDPEGWESDSFNYPSPIVWEVHVRDFSSSPSLGLKDAGKFSAFRSGVQTPAGHPALIDYLKHLGVTYVQLMPVADYGSVDELAGGYNWGYDPQCYFSPEGSYSSDPRDGLARVREFKTLVRNLHSAGIGVIMDVVFNHTYTKDDNPLDICAPDYYYRMKGGKPCNGSGCGNETASEKEWFRRLMIDCVCHYAREYHINGFRFDLMGLHDVDTMNALRAALDDLFPDGSGKKILTYGEPWYCAPPYNVIGADKEHVGLLNERIGVFNDTFRNAVKGSSFEGLESGFVQGEEGQADAILSGICGGVSDDEDFLRVKAPSQQVLYASCHDDYTLYDHIMLTAGKEADLGRMCRTAAFLTLSGLGIPFMLAGEEFLRTKGGDGNSYKSGDGVNALDWARADRYWNTVEYYRGLIALRKSNRAFDDLSATSAFTLISKGENFAAYRIGGVIYAFNGGDEDVAVSLPYSVGQVCDAERSGTQVFSVSGGGFVVKAHGVFAGVQIK